MDEDEDEDATTRWSEDGAAFARALSETRSSTSTSTATASVMTRIGEVVWRSTFDGAVPLAGMGLALAKKKKTMPTLPDDTSDPRSGGDSAEPNPIDEAIVDEVEKRRAGEKTDPRSESKLGCK